MEEKTNFFEKFWYLFVILALILVGFVGSLWFLNQKAIKTKQLEITPVALEETTSALSEEENEIATLENQDESDEVESIEADLQNTNLSNLDKEMADIETEITTED